VNRVFPECYPEEVDVSGGLLCLLLRMLYNKKRLVTESEEESG
jgi:hypothetical protein